MNGISENHLKMITELRHELHRHPEVSMKEIWTKQRLMDFIREHTELEVVDQGHWFYVCCRAHCGGKLPPVAFRADFDALPMEEGIALPYGSCNPGCAHKCGHDGHSAVMAGVALELDAAVRKTQQETAQPNGSQRGLNRDIYLIFQHAEEIGGGGLECAGLIKQKGICQVYAFHNLEGYPEGAVAVRYGAAQCASKGFTVHFLGTLTHASQPEKGKNPATAVAELVLYARQAAAQKPAAQKPAAQEPAAQKPGMPAETGAGGYAGMVMLTVVQIAVGHKDFGIAAHEGEVSMTLRADYEEDMAYLEQAIRSRAEELAERDGLEVSFAESDVFPDTVNHAQGVETVKKAARANGLQVIDMSVPFRASEDFGYYLKECPGAIFYVGNGENYPPLHTAGYDFNDHILKNAVDMFLRIAESA